MPLLNVFCIKKEDGEVVEIQGSKIPQPPNGSDIIKVKAASFKPPIIIKGLKGRKKYQVIKITRKGKTCLGAFDPQRKNPRKNLLKDYPEC